LDKVLYPESGFTKGQVLDYYAKISDVILPHIKDRPLTLKRYPNGVDGMSFFEKHAPSHRPEWVRTAEVPSSRSAEPILFAVVCDRPTLLWAANLAALELHVPLWRVGKGRALPAPPDYMVFDLDPGPGTTIVECCRVARFLTDRLGEENLFAKTSGSKGLQLYIALTRTTSDQAGEQAHEIAVAIEKDHPEAVVSRMRKDLRSNKVLIDWSQNNPHKTTVAVYSLRARPTPTVSTPVSWQEVDRCAKSGNPDDLRFETKDVLRRVEKYGDLMKPLVAPRGQRASPRKSRA
jgi:bifunctional non-homologous end joining protein LigD